MSLTIITPAESQRLTTFERVASEYGGLDVAFQPRIESWIDVASAQCNEYCNRVFAREEVQEVITPQGGQVLSLKRLPLFSVASIVLDDEPTTEITGYTMADAGLGELYLETGWPRWKLRVTYTGGFILPSFTGQPPNLPPTVEQACVLLTKGYYMGAGVDPNITQHRIGDFSATYNGFMGTGGGLPMAVKSLLSSHRVIRF